MSTASVWKEMGKGISVRNSDDSKMLTYRFLVELSPENDIASGKTAVYEYLESLGYSVTLGYDVRDISFRGCKFCSFFPARMRVSPVWYRGSKSFERHYQAENHTMYANRYEAILSIPVANMTQEVSEEERMYWDDVVPEIKFFLEDHRHQLSV